MNAGPGNRARLTLHVHRSSGWTQRHPVDSYDDEMSVMVVVLRRMGSIGDGEGEREGVPKEHS